MINPKNPVLVVTPPPNSTTLAVTPPAKAAAIDPKNAKDEPKNTGLLNLVKSK